MTLKKPMPRADGDRIDTKRLPANSWRDHTSHLQRPMIAHYDVSDIGHEGDVEDIMRRSELIRYHPINNLGAVLDANGNIRTQRLRIPRGYHVVRMEMLNTDNHYCWAVLCYPRNDTRRLDPQQLIIKERRQQHER